MFAYIITNAVEIILLEYGKWSNIPEEFRPIFNMKNEFYFDRLVIGDTKKRYISRILLREGNLMNPPKYDLKGFDFKKSTTAEFAEEFFMYLIKKYIINSETIDVKAMLMEIMEFKKKIIESISSGETTFLPNLAVKEKEAYAHPESQQAYKATLAWNILNPDEGITPPAKISALKLNIFELDDIKDLEETHPDIYERIKTDIFEDSSGVFVKKDIEPAVDYVNTRKKEWYKDIPSKYRTKYKKLGAKAWNEFVDTLDLTDPKYAEEVKLKYDGMQVLAIPTNGTVPEYIVPYIDFTTIVNNILSPFIPILEIFGIPTMEEGRRHGSVDRTSEAITNLVKI